MFKLTFDEAIEYLKSCTKFGIKLGLERITVLLNHLGNPQKDFKIIHIAGTNGKGSTSAMLSSVLRHAGYKTATYNSPHLVTYRERFCINGELISKEKLAQVMEKLKVAIEKTIAEGFGTPTEFEVGTALAFQYFADEKVDIAVVEVGMGGRFDATNVVWPLLSIITHIALDHCEYLGDSLEKIAYEKAGIIKPKTPTVVGIQTHVIELYLKRIANDRHSPIKLASDYRCDDIESTVQGSTFTADGESFFLPLHGLHQIKNCLNVLAAVDFLQKDCDLKITSEDLHEGIAATVWPCRFERIPQESGLQLYLDGSHNPDGVEALVQTIQSLYPQQKVDLLLGILGNRPIDKMAKILAPVVRRVITTTVPDPKSSDPHQLASYFTELGIPTLVEPDPSKALKLLQETDNSVAVTAGSLYLTGLLRGILLNLGD